MAEPARASEGTVERWSYARYWSLIVGELSPTEAAERYALQPGALAEWLETREADEWSRLDDDAALPEEWNVHYSRALVELTTAAREAAAGE